MSVLAAQRPGNKLIHAEGEAQEAEKLSEAANIISVYPDNHPSGRLSRFLRHSLYSLHE